MILSVDIYSRYITDKSSLTGGFIFRKRELPQSNRLNAHLVSAVGNKVIFGRPYRVDSFATMNYTKCMQHSCSSQFLKSAQSSTREHLHIFLEV